MFGGWVVVGVVLVVYLIGVGEVMVGLLVVE